MTVKEFFEKFDSLMKFNVNLYEVNENVEIDITADQIKRDDGLHEEWKNAEVYVTPYDGNLYIEAYKKGEV